MKLDAARETSVRAELHRILASADFDASERNRRFLAFVVEETLAGRGDRIKAYTVATTVFGRGPDFDPQVDSIVRIEAGRLRRSLERLYLISGKDDRVRIVIPKGSYTPTFSLADRDTPPPQRERAATRPGIALFVRPFEEESDSARYPHFASGFTRQVIAGLVRFTDLMVYGPETSMALGTIQDIAELKARIEVDYVLSGGVMVAGDAVGVEVLLTCARTGLCLWAESFHRSFDPSEIIALRDDIANQVVRTLAQPYGVFFARRSGETDGRATTSMSAYDAVTLFYVYTRTFDRDRFAEVFERLTRTVEREPDYAEGIACLSRLWSDVHRHGYDPGIVEPAPLDRAEELARRAVALAPRSSRCVYALGLVLWLRRDVEASIEAYETGLLLNPNDTDLMAELGFRHALRLDFDRGVPLLAESFRRNPSQPGTYRIAIALWHLMEGRYRKAREEAQRTGMPQLPHATVIEAVAAVRLGDHGAALAAVEALRRKDPSLAEAPFDWLTARSVHPALVKLLVEGLVDAGLAVPESQVLRAGEEAA